ncbi:ras association domain-containing protein 7 isoform X1 [Ochotona curzoniae]|uniref:ras association domain-containing protein 7 isoform X1 n=1 Tax=Ochotona curzoniae TaxID=130825 RepID=UPI001B350034|nr:ras association domain-containing protein 7 isoform X1 [Ochotona curzoniae]XP_040826706.1 ras association domain-containing protein 7 isoform X1 [Ochotona curzoniae]
MLLHPLAMELKVWVDGIPRVVCGVSEQTTCQEVVIALAQAIGQTGRFVLVQRLREKERQLLPQECPVGAQATCGQLASDVQFVLRRTGPSQGCCLPPERCAMRASLPPKSRGAREPGSPATPTPGHGLDLQGLELRVQRNSEELGHLAFWEQELLREQAREREGQARLQALTEATAEHASRLQALDVQARALEAELQLLTGARETPLPTAPTRERLCQDLAAQERLSAEVQGSLALVHQALAAAEQALQAQAQELEELNRELRQCNLQQFIQQAGAALPPPPRPTTQPLLPPAQAEAVLGACRLNPEGTCPLPVQPPAPAGPFSASPTLSSPQLYP